MRFSRRSISSWLAVGLGCLALHVGPQPAVAGSGSATISGSSTAITAGWRGTVAGAEFLSRCLASQAVGGSALPASNGAGAYIIDMGAPRTGFAQATARVPSSKIGPPIPDPTRTVFPSGSFQLHNYDLDLYFVSEQCNQTPSIVTQNPNEAGSITIPSRYVVILLAFNGTGSPSVTVDWRTP